MLDQLCQRWSLIWDHRVGPVVSALVINVRPCIGLVVSALVINVGPLYWTSCDSAGH